MNARALLGLVAGVLVIPAILGILLVAHRGATSAARNTGSVSVTINRACPASIALPAWTHQMGVSTVRLSDGGLGYLGTSLRQEAVFIPQRGWQLQIGGLSVTDANIGYGVVGQWPVLPGTGRASLNPLAQHWTLVARWRTSDGCFGYTSPVSSLNVVPALLSVARLPHLAEDSRVRCRLSITARGEVVGSCRPTP